MPTCVRSHRAFSLLLRSISFYLCYAMVIALIAPLSILREVEAKPVKIAKPALPSSASASSHGTASSAAASTAAAKKKAPKVKDRELVVRFKAETTEASKQALFATNSLRRIKKLKGKSRLERIEIPAGVDPENFAATLRAYPDIEVAEPNYLVERSDITPNDPSFAQQWALKNTGQASGRGGSDINASAAWNTTTGASSTVIAVIDSGIDFTHPDLQNNEWTNEGEIPGNNLDDDNDTYVDDVHGWDWITNSNVITDAQGHGTNIAGIIAAEGNNSEGISGVMWHASLMSLRVLDNTGTGSVANAVEAIDYAVAKGAKVINCSWGTDSNSQILRDAIDRASAYAVVVVASAGNSSRNIDDSTNPDAPYYPSSYGLANVISVAATDNQDNLASFSNWGSSSVTLAAPGVNILTTKMGGGYQSVTGTSASAPVVSGVAGLIKTQRPLLAAPDTVASIKAGVRNVSTLASKVSTSGVVSAAGALQRMSGTDITPPPPPVLHGPVVTATPPSTPNTVGQGLPNLDQTRNSPPPTPAPPSGTIHSDLPCLDCGGGGDPGGGGGAGGADPYFATERTKPKNATGQPGVDLGSRNFNWSTPLVSLPGRAGLDLNLGLYYNSLVWTKQDTGTGIEYNADRGFPGPGFHTGLPILQPRYTNSLTGGLAYMMVMPDGSRIEMRQNGANYESADNSHTFLTEGSTDLAVWTKDGTLYYFSSLINNAWRCTTIRDRNGNVISATYDSLGHIRTIVDTLNRTINFNYDDQNPNPSLNTYNLLSITQQWAGVQHNWATFSYGSPTMNASFPGLAISGITNGGAYSALTRVTLADGSHYDFNYTNFGQVWQIIHYANDGTTQLAYTSYNLPGSGVPGSPSGPPAPYDCPRFTERHEWSLWGVMNASQEVVYTYQSDGSTYSQVTAPDGTAYKEIYYTAPAWANGLTSQIEVRSNGTLKKHTVLSWTQDDPSRNYQTNPRIIETNVYDDSSSPVAHRRTGYSYTSYGLVNAVVEYAADATTPIRQTNTSYNLGTSYLNQHIIGLPAYREIYGFSNGSSVLTSQTGFVYDETGTYLQDQGNPVQHDAGYSASMNVRGNLTHLVRYDVSPGHAGNIGYATQTATGYNTAGSVIFSADASGHQISIGYSENYSDGNNSRNTLAYPTRITDGDGFNTYNGYIYSYGGMVDTQDPKGANFHTDYDSVGRITRVTNSTNGAYTRYGYGPHYQESWTTVESGQGESYTVTYFDGVGRVRATATDFYNNGTAYYRAFYNMWDNMGRLKQRSNPAQITGSWVPAGDDTQIQGNAATGWQWTTLTYDWMGRATLTTNPDGTTTGATYNACGCAGSDTVTTRDERGRQKTYTKDVLGRLYQVQELNWDSSVYSTTTYSYNTLDQLTQITQGTQTRTFNYDGYGRMWQKITPEQGLTTYAYNADDTVQTITDARTATQNFTYNGRHLPTAITYGANGGAAATPSVSFSYDVDGNRTQMNDGYGTVYYNYDTISRLTEEMRVFSGLTTGPSTIVFNGSTIGNGYKLSYSYDLQGNLLSMTNPFPNGSSVSYTRNWTGDVTGVSGGGYGGVSTYASGITTRAFGAVKGINYGNGKVLSAGYDNRMRVSAWNVAGLGMNYQYSYNNFSENTGRVTYVKDVDAGQATRNRSFNYDAQGRLIAAYTGAEADAHTGQPGSAWGTQNGFYAQGFSYDVFGNITSRSGWGGWNPSVSYSYTNNKINGVTYDAAGELTYDGQQFTYDAAGRQATAYYAAGPYDIRYYFDGDGQRVEKYENTVTTYYLRSSVLGGQVVTEINSSGGWQRGFVYLGSQMMAIQNGNAVHWVHQDPVVKSQRFTNSSGGWESSMEMDPFGGETSYTDNTSSKPEYQSHRYATYERDMNSEDYAMARQYHGWYARFDHPDPYDGSYNLSDPQSFNRYSYVGNDPVNHTDPSGLEMCYDAWCGLSGGGGSFFGSVGNPGAGFSSHISDALGNYDQRIQNSLEALALSNALHQAISNNDQNAIADIKAKVDASSHLQIIGAFSQAQMNALDLIGFLFGNEVGDKVRFEATNQLTGLDKYILNSDYDAAHRTFVVNFSSDVSKFLDKSPYFGGPGIALLHLGTGTFDYRSYTDLTGLSQQIVPYRNNPLIGYADFDKNNPYQDLWSLLRHNFGEVLPHRIARIFGAGGP